MKKIKATCAILEMHTDAVISERFIGEYDTEDEAVFAAHKERKDGETVCIYGAPVQEEECMSAREMSEIEADWIDAQVAGYGKNLGF